MIQFTKRRWLLGVVGLFMYVADICTDTALVFTYFKEKDFVCATLTLLFIMVGLLVTQIFSSAWYWDDMNCGLIRAEMKSTLPSVSKWGLAALHLLGVGVFIRYGSNSENRCISVLLYLTKYEYTVCSPPMLHVHWFLG